MTEMMKHLDYQLIMTLSDRTQIQFTYSQQESDDNRFQEEVSFCSQDAILMVVALLKEVA